MGVWGTGIFQNDDACDVRDDYREQIEKGVEDDVATASTLHKFSSYFEDPDAGPVCILALAITQSKIGRLDPELLSRALAAIDSGVDIVTWERDNPKSVVKRRAVLEKARAQLIGPQPARKRLRGPRKETCGLVAGDGLALTTSSGLALLRVVRVEEFRGGQSPILEELEFLGSELPSQLELDQLKAAKRSKITGGDESRFSAFVGNGPYVGDWQHWGFRKVASFATRPGDEECRVGRGIAWIAVAGRLRGEERWL